MPSKKRVLFICTNNSARSKMAEGLLRHLYGDKYEVYSAGTNPTKVNPYAVQVMAERGIDISAHSSKSLQKFLDRKLDFIITVCDRANETCPFFFGQGGQRIHQSFFDPVAVEGSEADKLKAFRQVREKIEKWITETFGQGLEEQ